MFKKFARDLINYVPSKLLPAITSFISTPILTRLFLPSIYANYALATALSDFLYAFSCSGFGSGVFRYYPAYKAKSQLNSFFSIYTLFICGIITVVSILGLTVLFLFRDSISPELFPLLLISILAFFISSIIMILMEVLRAEEKSGLYTTIQLVTTYGGLILGLILVMFFHTSIEGLLWGNLIVAVIFLPIIFRQAIEKAEISPRHIHRADLNEIWKFAWPLTVGNMALWGLRLSDRYILGLYRLEHEVGIYSVAYNISNKSIDIIVTLFILTMSPLIMNTWVNQGRENTEKALAMVTRLYLILGIPAVVGLTMLAYPIVSLLTTPPYYEGYRIVSLVGLSSFFWGLTQIANRGLLIGKSTRKFATHQLIAAFVNIGLNFLLVPRFGFIAAGVTTLIGYLILFIIQAIAAQKYLTWQIPFRSLINILIAASIMAVTIFTICNLLHNQASNIIQLVCSIAVGIPLYFGVLLLLGEANTDERDMLKKVIARVQG